jgi:methyl-accepting chemotaxis protein
MSIWTTASVAFIILVAIYYFSQVIRVRILRGKIENNIDKCLTGDIEKPIRFKALIEDYYGSMQIINSVKRTNTPADYYLNEKSVCDASKINLRQLDAAAGILVGLGLLGTFLGLTIGLTNFDSSSTDTIQQSIQTLLDGMATAFITSLVGMFLSLLYTFFDKRTRNRLYKAIKTLSAKLDNKYYIDDVELMLYHNEIDSQRRNKEQNTFIQELIEKLTTNVVQLLNNQTDKVESVLKDNLSYDKEGEIIPLINIARELHIESREQTKALKSFSTDLAMELNNGFDEMLSRQLQAKLIPLMESVDKTTKIVIEHIDSMAQAVKSPADNMVNAVVGELKNSLQDVMHEFKSNISENTKDELERIAHTLNEASSTITTFPTNMEQITQSFQTMIGEMKQSVVDTTKGSAEANADAMEQMKDQVLVVSKTLADSVENIHAVMMDLTTNSQKGSNAIIEQMSNTVSSVNEKISEAMANMGQTLTKQMSSLSDDITSKQTDLLALQEDTVSQIRAILSQFKESVGYMENANKNVSNTLGQMETVHTHIANSTANLRDVSESMKMATNDFHKTQADYTASVVSSERSIRESISNMDKMLSKTGEVSEEYLSEFGALKDGLGKVFAQIQQGLNDYSQRVRETTSKYLSDYSTALTNTVDQINNTVGEIRDIVDALEEQLGKLKK